MQYQRHAQSSMEHQGVREGAEVSSREWESGHVGPVGRVCQVVGTA